MIGTTIGKKTKTLRNKKINDIIFCCGILLYPTVQFCIFYLGVNFNSLLLAFKSYEYGTGYTWSGFANFKAVIFDIFNTELLKISFKNSLSLYAITLLIGTTLSLLFSYYIYEKQLFHGFYKVMLFLPSIISSLALTMIFRFFVGRLYPELVKEITGKVVPGLLTAVKTRKSALIFFTLWVNFGITVLIYSGAMSGINESVVEYAKIDGANSFQKFIYIVFPLIFPTFTTFIVIQVVEVFTNQMHLFSFYGSGANYSLYTIGYFLYKRTSEAAIIEYPYLATMGILFSFISIPATFIVKNLLERFGPKDY